MRITLFIAFIVLISSILYIPDNDVRCVDGDTFKVGRTYYRLSYVDTPERGDKGYNTASAFTCGYLKMARFKDFTKIYNGKDIYGRTLVEISRGGTSLNKQLIQRCLAEPFYGKTTDEILKLYKTGCKDYK